MYCYTTLEYYTHMFDSTSMYYYTNMGYSIVCTVLKRKTVIKMEERGSQSGIGFVNWGGTRNKDKGGTRVYWQKRLRIKIYIVTCFEKGKFSVICSIVFS